MSTIEQRRAAETAKSQEEARSRACVVCRDFLSDWGRVSSIIGLMEDAVREEVKEAGDAQMETWLPEVVAANTNWLREQLKKRPPMPGSLLRTPASNVVR
jgi:hypothetical protein